MTREHKIVPIAEGGKEPQDPRDNPKGLTLLLEEDLEKAALGTGGDGQEQVLECYERTANLFKIAKKWPQAGNTFVTLAQHHTKLENKRKAATNYVNASNCYKKSDPYGNITPLTS